MKILKVFEDVELILVDLEVNMGSEKRSAPTLCARYCLLYTSDAADE